ncbi:MAG: putative toxin-antitoxin system toxin component, PIN family [Nitrospinae bacterium]|nr:putative toxin-antitoxin system toxin component, PIN family [Nitrospinota bacterium]
MYISAFLYPERPLFQILPQAAQRRYHLLMSPAIVREAGRVMRERLGWEEDVRIRHLKTLTKAGEIITPQITLAVIPEDPPDNRVLECAVEGRANLIVSGDRHLRRLKMYQGIPIVRPIDFLRALGIA